MIQLASDAGLEISLWEFFGSGLASENLESANFGGDITVLFFLSRFLFFLWLRLT